MYIHNFSVYNEISSVIKTGIRSPIINWTYKVVDNTVCFDSRKNVGKTTSSNEGTVRRVNVISVGEVYVSIIYIDYIIFLTVFKNVDKAQDVDKIVSQEIVYLYLLMTIISIKN